MTRPDPLVPQDVDLRDFAFMPLDVLRLRDSDLAALATGEQFKSAVLLWCAAWHQVPAGSVPNDERWLARHSGAGAAWKKVREEALRGFVECSDGRLYHAVVAEKALEAWTKKQEQRVRTLKARIASTEKRMREARTDAERQHAQTQLQGLLQDLSQLLSQGLLQPMSQPPRDSKGTGTGTYPPVSPPRGASESEPFLAFWAAWPKSERKEAKGKCWEVWSKGKFDAVAGEILAHVEAMKGTKRWREGFICAPLVYLRNRRWEGSELESEDVQVDL